MEKLEPLDILQVPSKEETEIAKIYQWAVSIKKGKNQKSHFTFEYETPQEILVLFKKDKKILEYDLGQKIDSAYSIAPKGVMNKWKALVIKKEK